MGIYGTPHTKRRNILQVMALHIGWQAIGRVSGDLRVRLPSALTSDGLVKFSAEDLAAELDEEPDDQSSDGKMIS